MLPVMSIVVGTSCVKDASGLFRDQGFAQVARVPLALRLVSTAGTPLFCIEIARVALCGSGPVEVGNHLD